MAETNLPRRRFLRGEFLTSLQSEKTKTQGFQGIRPPWAQVEDIFLQYCTRCGDCVSQCETQILIKGEGGFPEVQFSRGECTFCQQCVQVCQQPIFRDVQTPAWQHKIEIGANCLAQQQVECRSCEDYCATQAIRFQRTLGGVAKPTLQLEKCNGCGGCLQSCPVSAIKIRHEAEEIKGTT